MSRAKFPQWDYPFNHGFIDRKVCEKRLRDSRQKGVCLFRCKDQQGTEFVYSYYDAAGYRHAKIEIKGFTFSIDNKKYQLDHTADLADVFEQSIIMHKESGMSEPVGLSRPQEKTEEPVIRAGTMSKRAIGRSLLGFDNWKIRFFELTKSALVYYNKQGGTKKGAIQVNQMVAVEKTKPELYGKKFVFLIVFKYYICYVQAQSVEDQDGWVSALQELIKVGNRVNTTYCPGLLKHGRWNCCQSKNRSAGCHKTSFFLEMPGAGPGAATIAREQSLNPVAQIPAHLNAPWYFPEFSRSVCETIMKSANPGEYIGRKSRYGDKIVMMVMDETHKLRHFYLTPQSDGTVEISPGVFKATLQEAMDNFERFPPQGQDGRVIVLLGMVKVDAAMVAGAGKEHVARAGVVAQEQAALDELAGLQIKQHKLWDDRDETDDGESLEMHFQAMDELEFGMMDTRDTHAEELPVYARGLDMNRYWDILPNPVTRVRLTLLPDGGHTEYINANYIRGYNNRSAREYIAAQAPERSTQHSFIRMIWEKNVDICVVLTKLVQEGRNKCHRYWPVLEDEPVISGNFTITMLSSEYGNGLVKYVLEISDGNDTRKFSHFWFNSWPDHDVPIHENGEMDSECILSLIQDVRRERRKYQRANPMLVHCSAGIGRTGAFIAIDHAINAMQARAKVDITDIVRQLREDRMGMVQHTSQYKFIFQAALDYARTRFKNSTVLAQVDVSQKKEVGDRMTADTVKKNGTWNMHDLSDTFATYKLRDEPVGLTCDEHDFEIIPEDDTRPVPDGIGETNEAVQQQLQAKPLAQQPWFKSGFSRSQAEELLQDGYQGMFIVRESSQPGLFSVSVQAGNETFDHPSKITNMLCLPAQEANGETKFKLGDFGEAYFSTIPELIAYYQKKPYTRSEATGKLMFLKFFDFGMDEGMSDALKNLQARYDKGDVSKTGSIC